MRWAVKAGELRPLSRGGLVLFAARCALRAEPWLPPEAGPLWADNLAFVVASAPGEPAGAAEAAKRRRSLSDSGAEACNRLESVDEPLGRCMGYAMSTLASAVEAAAIRERPAVLKVVITAAKLSASISAVWAHAGRIRVRGDAVDVACATTREAIKADIGPLAAALPALEASSDRVRALRKLQALWPGRAPAWASPP